jgi:hypothetical protein
MGTHRFCGDCGQQVPVGQRFCGNCGGAVESGATEPITTVPSAPAAASTAALLRRLRWPLVAAAALVLLLLAGGAAFALTKHSGGGSSGATSWPPKDVRLVRQSCATTGTSALTCQQQLTCLERHVQPSTYEHIAEAESHHTADGKRLNHCMVTVPFRARFSQQCLDSWNLWVPYSGIGQVLSQSGAGASLEAVGSGQTQSCFLLLVGSSTVTAFVSSSPGQWTFYYQHPKTAHDRNTVPNTILNTDGTLAALPAPVTTQANSSQADPAEQHCVDQWNASGMASYIKGKATVSANPCLVVWFSVYQGAVSAVFPCSQSGITYQCPEHGWDQSLAKQQHSNWFETNAHIEAGKLVLDNAPSSSSGSVTTPDLPTDNGYLIPVDAGGQLNPGITVQQVVSTQANCSVGFSESANGQAMRCFAGNGIYDPCWATTTPAEPGDLAYCPTAAGVKTVFELTIKTLS